jgi:putative ABC transport system permease protein
MKHPRLERGRPRLAFYLYLAHRVNIAAHPGMAILTVLAVAAATALAVGVEIASRAVRQELHQTAKAILGNADLEVVAGNRGIPEGLVEKVAGVPGVFEASPVISEVVRINGGPLDGLALNILGVDLLAKRQMREISVTRDRVAIRDPLRLLVKPNSIVIAASLAEKLGVREGETFRVAFAGFHDLVVEGIIAPSGLGDAFNGQLGIMDVWSLQHLVRAQGYVDKIEVTATSAVALEPLSAEIQAAVGGVATTRRVLERESFAAVWLGVLDRTAWGTAAVASLVATLLAYTAISHIVDRRMLDFALMQCSGMDHRGVQLLIAADALMLSGIGGILGLGTGVLASPLILTAISRYSEHLQQVRIEGAELSASTMVAALLVCLVVAALAGLPHALRARTSHPLELASTYRRSGVEPALAGVTLLGLLAFLAAAVLLWQSSAPAALRLGGLIACGLAGVGIFGGRFVRKLARLVGSGFSRGHPGTLLLGASLPTRSAPLAASVALIASLTLSTTLLIVLVESIVGTMQDEIVVRYGDGAVVRSVPTGSEVPDTISTETIRKVKHAPGVRDVAEYYDTELYFRGEEFHLRAFDSAALFRNATMLEEETPVAEVRDALRRGELVITPGFGRFFSVSPGDEIDLDTPEGPRKFRVGGTARGFAGPTGIVYMDLQTFDRHFRREGASFLALWADRSLQGVLDELVRSTAGTEVLFFESGTAFSQAARRIVERFSSLLYALLALAAFLAGIGVAAVVASAVVSRREDLALMQVAGATPATIACLVLLDAAFLMSMGAWPGVLLGSAAADVAGALFRESFGWSLDRHLAAGRLALAVGVLLACATSAAIGPAWFASRSELPSSLPRL